MHAAQMRDGSARICLDSLLRSASPTLLSNRKHVFRLVRKKAVIEYFSRGRRTMRLNLLCLVALVVTTAEAQVQPNDFDVPDGRIEKSAGNHLMVSTKEMRATLKFPTQ